jgi:dUTP pyrophosphatase
VTEIRVVRLPHGADLPLPAYQSAQAAGLDLVAAVAADEPIMIPPGGRVAVPTGIAVALPPDHEGQIRPRSGIAMRHGVTVLNTPGTIDPDYRGEILVILINHGSDTFEVKRGTRIAQLVIAPIQRVKLREATRLDETERKARGFGSTGMATNGIDEAG